MEGTAENSGSAPRLKGKETEDPEWMSWLTQAVSPGRVKLNDQTHIILHFTRCFHTHCPCNAP